MRFPNADSLRHGARIVWLSAEIVILTGLILVTRCANFPEVFINGKIYFVDADCYARMTRVRMVAAHPGLVVRHHDFENYPLGIAPHTTAPLDYLIAGLGKLLSSATAQPIDLAGAIISPLLALGGGWFLWWWSRRMQFRYRWAGLFLYALCPILAHGTELGRPDHQSLLIVLLLVALAAEWSLRGKALRGWSIVSGLSWGVALWVSLYEPLVLLAAIIVFSRGRIFTRERRVGWYLLAGILVLAALVERRWPQFPDETLRPFLAHWSTTIGELQSISLTNPIWLQWFGFFILGVPLLIFFALREKVIAPVFAFLLALLFLLTIWQARWGYFLGVVLVVTIPALLELVRQRWLGILLVAVALLPCLQFWDDSFWPNESVAVRRTEGREEAIDWRAAAMTLPHDRLAPFLAPWWLSPEVSYWSAQPGVAGSAHEGLAGIVASARFFLASSPNESKSILRVRGAEWVFVYDAERVAQNSAAILHVPAPPGALCFTLDRTPSRAPAYLRLVGENSSCKLYRLRD